MHTSYQTLAQSKQTFRVNDAFTILAGKKKTRVHINNNIKRLVCFGSEAVVHSERKIKKISPQSKIFHWSDVYTSTIMFAMA